MIPFEIKEVSGLVTAIDTPDSNENIFQECRGGYPRLDGDIFRRDSGCVMRIAPSVPLRPNAFKAITGAASNGAPNLIRITATGHGFKSGVTISGCANNGSGLIRITVSTSNDFSTDESVKISGVTGTTEANRDWIVTKIDATHYDLQGSVFTNTYINGGTVQHMVWIDEVGGTVEAIGKWPVTVIGADTFDLVGSTFTNAYTSGGIACKIPIKIVKIYTFIDTDNTEYEILVGKDSSSNLRVYVYDSTSTEASKWIELSRFFTATINGTPPSATAQTFAINNIQENGVAYTGAADFVNNWIVVNTTQSETVFITDSDATSLTVDTIIGSNGLAWVDTNVINIYRFPCFKFNYTPANGATPWVSFLGEPTQRKVAMFYQHTDGTKHQAIQIMKRSARNYFQQVSTGFAVAQIIFGAPVSGDLVQVSTGVTTRSFVYLGTETQRFTTADELTANINFWFTDVTAVNSSGTITITAKTAGSDGNAFYLGLGIANTGTFQISNTSQGATSTASSTRYFEGGTVTGTYLRTLPAGWYCESDFGIINPFFLARGSTVAPYVANTNGLIYDQTAGRPWLITNSKRTTDATQNDAGDVQQRVYLIGEYGYQFSDVLMQLFIEANLPSTGSPVSDHYLAINFALMNKELTALRLYACQNTQNGVDAGWIDAASEYFLCHTLNIQSANTNGGFAAVTTVSQVYTFVSSGTTSYMQITPTTITDAITSKQPSLLTDLNHEPDKNRSYPTPRYGIKTARAQGAVSVIDVDDNTLRFSLWDGEVNQDDNFVATEDTQDAVKLKLALSGSGTILGLAEHRGTIQIFRKTERLFYNTQSTQYGSKPCDFVSRDSLVSPIQGFDGLAWMGNAGIYLLPSDGSEEIKLSAAIQNKIDGTLMVTGTTPYITSTYRAASVGGWDELNKSLQWNLQMNRATGSEFVSLVYSFTERPVTGQKIGWYERKWNIGTDGSIKCFSRRQSDNTLTVVYQYGILKYPNSTGTYPFQDDVLVGTTGTEFSQSKGIPTKFRIMCGRLYNLVNKNVFDFAKMDFVGSSISTNGIFNWLFYINKKTSAQETKGVPIDKACKVRKLPPFGAVERFATEVNLTENGESDFKDFVVSTMVFNNEKIPQMGNQY